MQSAPDDDVARALPYYKEDATLDSACTAVSSATSPSRAPPTRSLRLYFSARDLPEPDARSRASYAVIYHAKDTPAAPSDRPSVPSKPPSRADPPAPSVTGSVDNLRHPPFPTPPTHISAVSDASADSDRHRVQSLTSSTSSSVGNPASAGRARKFGAVRSESARRRPAHPVPDANLVRHASAALAVKNPHKSSAIRAPHLASVYAAPDAPSEFVADDGTRMHRTAWTRIGATDIARKHGRDVEFARSFRFEFNAREAQVIRVVFFDCTSKKVEKQRLIGTAELRVSAVYAARGVPVSFPLRFMAVTKKDVKKSWRIPVGALVVAGQHVKGELCKYRLDVECNRILRAKALSTAAVKRTFYTIHAVLDAAKDSDHWTLLYRSDAVEMIHKKKDGGSLEYNYFSSRRLIAKPGVIIEDSDAKAGRDDEDEGAEGVAGRVGRALGIRQRERFFSLPGADLLLESERARLKLSLFEDNGQLGGFDFIADTQFTIGDLKRRELGESCHIRVHANVVGKAILKYVECSKDPRYFCLSLMLQSVR